MALKQIGAVWRKKGKDGSTHFSGIIEYIAGLKAHVILMPYKPKDNVASARDPAYTVLLDVPDDKKNKEQDEGVKIEKVNYNGD